jgi:cytochrome oxidase Cu insertion factor (SCO1/SenC/PrrC family)
MNTEQQLSQVEFHPWRFWMMTGSVIACLIGLSALAGKLLDDSLPAQPLPILATIKRDLEATERLGQTVRFSQLRGKVVVCAYLYTLCPHGCAAVTAQMQKLHQEFAQHSGLHLLSVAVQPGRDNVSMLKGYAEAVGVGNASSWWFITGQQDQLWDFMTQDVGMTPSKLIPEDERMTPDDQYEHDLRIALIDPEGRVRGYYAVFHPQAEIATLMCERLHQHVHQLLKTPHS